MNALRLRAIATGLFLVVTGTHAQDDWSRVVEAAKKEGKVVIYNGSSPGLTDVIAKAFTKKYGIAVDRLDARPVEVRERIRSEQAASRFVGDVTISISETLKRQMTDGVLQAHRPVPSVKLSRAEWMSDGTVVPFAVVKWAVLVNNAAVPPGSEPRSWQDLLDPKWKGRILMDDPRTNGGGHFLFAATYKRFGKQFHEKLAAQKPVLSSNVALNERRIAQGEFAIYTPQVVPNLVRLNGLPVRAIVPSEGLPYGASAIATLKQAPHPNAAALYIDFTLSDEAQEAITSVGYSVVTNHTPKAAPGAQARLANAPQLGTAKAAEAEALLKIAAEIYR